MIMFLLQKFKMMTSPYAFLIFSKSLFSGLLGRGKRAKNGPKWQKIISLCILGTVSHMIVVFVTHVKWWYLQQLFFIFSKFWFFGFIKVCQKEIVVSNAFSSLYKMLSIIWNLLHISYNDETWYSIPYLKKIQNLYESCDIPLEFCWHQHF